MGQGRGHAFDRNGLNLSRRDLQHPVEKLDQIAATFAHDIDQLALISSHVFQSQQFRASQNGIQVGPDLMAQLGQKN